MISNRQRGFTVVELMVTIAVAAILTAIALPNFRDFMRRNAVTSHMNELLGDLRYARQLANTDMSVVSVCASADPSATTPSCADDGHYEQGWIIYKAPTAGTDFSDSAGFELLRATQPMTNVSIRADSDGVVSFNQRGAATQGEANFHVCAKSSSDAIGQSTPRVPGLQLQLMASGRASSTQMSTSSDDDSARTLCQ
jgi:type IV fimbrial biogenesis protein FimT